MEGDAFTVAWQRLSSVEQAQLVTLWIERIDYDGAGGTVAITFHTANGQGPDQNGTGIAKETDS